MNEESIPNNVENDGFNLNTEDRDFNNLIIRLKGISKIIALLEKKYSEKF